MNRRDIKILLVLGSIVAILFGALIYAKNLEDQSRPKPKQLTSTENNWKVELLFEQDGCKVYRFQDYGTHYFTNCKGSTMTTKVDGSTPAETKTIDDVSGGK